MGTEDRKAGQAGELAMARRRDQAPLVAPTADQLDFALAAVPSLIWYKDARNRILWLNEAAAASMGLPREACLGADTYELFPDMAARYHRDDIVVLASGAPRLGIVERYTPREGRTGWVRTDKIPATDPETGEQRLLVVSTDITAFKRTEETLRQANESLKEFATTASHDLRAPLRQIMLLTELVEDALPEGTDEARDHLCDIRQVGDRLSRLLDSLLEVARVANVLPTLTPLSLRPLCERATAAAAREAAALGGSLRVADEGDALGDAVLLEQVLGNLAENAVKYRGDAPPDIEVTITRSEGYVQIAVADRGVGIPPEHRERVFEMFKRLDAGGPVTGHGIGLSLCRRIVAAHGGTITSEGTSEDGEDGEGTRMVVRLAPCPADQRAEEDRTGARGEAAS